MTIDCNALVGVTTYYLSEMDDIDALFEDSFVEKVGETPLTYGERTVMNIQAEYVGRGTYVQEREQEKRELQQKIQELRRALRKTKNIRNARRAEANAKAAQKRQKLKRQIAEIEMKLEDIAIEEGEVPGMKGDEDGE